MNLFYKNDFACGTSPDPFVLYDGGVFYLYYTGGRKLTAKRSRDLAVWEDVGTIFEPEEGSWIFQHLWAPEVIKWQGKYYMYVTASGNTEAACPEGTTLDGREGTVRFRPVVDGVTTAVLVSDTPVGPFRQWEGERPNITRYHHGKVVGKGDVVRKDTYPVFDFPNAPAAWAVNEETYARNGTNIFSVLDAHPFFDEDGTMYLYFVRSHDSNRAMHGIWGMRMLDPVTPDYETMVKLTEPMELYPGGPPSPDNYMDGKLNEGVFVVKRGSKYVMFYSCGDGYNTAIALSDTPLGRFTKLLPEYRNPILRISPEFGFYDCPEGWGVFGAGHGMVFRAGEEEFFASLTTRPVGDGSGKTFRTTMIDRLVWKYNEDLGVELPVINGPTAYTLQPVPAVVSGYKNIAPLARVELLGQETAKLTDGVIPILKRDDVHSATCYKTAYVTLEWSEPVEVAAVMVYNMRTPEHAFKGISEIILEGEKTKRKKNVPFPPEYLIGDPNAPRIRDDVELQKAETWVNAPLTDGGLLPGGAAIAKISAKGVRKLTIKTNQRLVHYGISVGISEIVVLGKTNKEA